MTRMVVALEGDENPINNCVIAPGALYLEKDEIPVVWNGDYSDHGKVLGVARDLQRDDDKVTMDIQLRDSVKGLDLEDKIGAYVFVQPFEAEPHALQPGAIGKVTSGRIRAVNLQDLG